jgi:hypothetical protein
MTACQLFVLVLLTLACGSAPSQSQNKTATSPPTPLLNIRDIANQTQEDIATILGIQSSLDPAAAARSGCPTCQKYAYQDGKIEIVYINDMADWITIFPPEGTPVGQIPVLLGLPNTPPDSTTPTLWQWKNIPDIREIQARLHPKGTVESVYVVVKTP